MSQTLQTSNLLAVPLAPLVGSVLAGVFGTQFGGNWLGRRITHSLTILGVLVAFVLSAQTLWSVGVDGARFNETLYTWMVVGGLKMEIGFLVDGLTAMMMCVVTFVSLMVHIYTIGYMEEDEGYNRFFSYISLFTFSMLMLVMSNNMLQLFFGWEAVGLVSYLLIGFWFNKPTAIFANMKAFLVNRVGDFGFILGIGLIAAFAGTLNYTEAFAKTADLTALNLPGTEWMLVRFGVAQSVAIGGVLTLTGGLLLTLSAWMAWHSVMALIGPFYIFMLGHGIHQPCGHSGSVGPFPQAAGAASALGGFLMMAVAFLMGLWLGQQEGGAVRGMAWGIGFWSVVTSLTAWTLVQRIGRKRA